MRVSPLVSCLLSTSLRNCAYRVCLGAPAESSNRTGSQELHLLPRIDTARVA